MFILNIIWSTCWTKIANMTTKCRTITIFVRTTNVKRLSLKQLNTISITTYTMSPPIIN